MNEATNVCEPCDHCFENEKKVPGECHDNCKTCSGPEENDCLTCYDDFEKRDNKASDYCDPKKYCYRDPTDPTKCIDCHLTCGERCVDGGEAGCTGECLA